MRKYLNNVAPTVAKAKKAVVFEEEEDSIPVNRKACGAFLRDTERKASRYFVGKAVQDLRSDFAY